jgi:hypothetical protein
MRTALVAVLVSAIGLAGCGGTDWSTRGGAPAARVAARSGTTFTDPQGTYTLAIDPQWIERSGAFVAEVEGWAVGPAADRFTPNVNVLTQSAPGVDLPEYLDLSVRNGPDLMASFQLVRAEQITGASGQLLGEMEYTAVAAGRELHLLAVVALAHGRAMIATLTTEESSFATLKARVEPFLVTLKAR